MLINASFNSQFSCCALICMSYHWMANNKINKLHETCLQIIYSNKSVSYEELLEKDGSVSLRHRNLRILDTKMFNFVKDISPAVMKFFHFFPQNRVNLKQVLTFYN